MTGDPLGARKVRKDFISLQVGFFWVRGTAVFARGWALPALSSVVGWLCSFGDCPEDEVGNQARPKREGEELVGLGS